MADPIRVDDSDGVTLITIDRPETKNALNFDALNGLIRALETAQTSPSKVVVLAGQGGPFSSGGDIQDMAARRGDAVATLNRLREGLVRIVGLLSQHPKPVLAHVDGECLGAGLGLALACDAILATRRSRFGFPFVKVGLTPDTASSWTLPRVVGLQQARRLLLTGELIDADAAEDLGIVTQLAPDAAALDALVREWVGRLAALPPTAIRDAKRLLWSSLEQPLTTATLHEALQQGIRFTTPEHAAAVDAFLAKKKG